MADPAGRKVGHQSFHVAYVTGTAAAVRAVQRKSRALPHFEPHHHFAPSIDLR
jgi:hypothetical protein